MPLPSDYSTRRDSWPPTQLRLSRSGSGKGETPEPRPLLDDIDENPLTYFLTPPSVTEGGDADGNIDDEDDDFDAGIEDPSRAQEMVRSVSPSSLEGMSRPLLQRAASPDFDSDISISDDDYDDDEEEEEEYVHFSPGSFHNPASNNFRYRPHSAPFSRSTNGLLSPTSSFPPPSWASSPRGRSFARSRHGTLTRSLSARPRANRVWREPSAGVWSIREETNEEMLKEMESQDGATAKTKAGKPQKKVRFMLPATQI